VQFSSGSIDFTYIV